MSHPVSPALIVAIRDGMLDGMSWQEIGDQVGRTKNAIASLCRRVVYPAYPGLQEQLGRHPRPPGAMPRKSKPQVVRLPRPLAHRGLTVVPMPEPALVAAPMTLVQLHQCQWPTTQGRRHQFLCREPVVLGQPYCDGHCRVAYLNWRRP